MPTAIRHGYTFAQMQALYQAVVRRLGAGNEEYAATALRSAMINFYCNARERHLGGFIETIIDLQNSAEIQVILDDLFGKYGMPAVLAIMGEELDYETLLSQFESGGK